MEITKVLSESSQATVFIGNYLHFEDLIDSDRIIVQEKPKVVLKQFSLQTDRIGFLMELQALKNIKQLDISNNGRFPVILSTKVS